MAWIIDKDHIAADLARSLGEPLAEPGTNLNAVGLMGPRDITPAEEQALSHGEGVPFKMFDDDGALYYEGRVLSPDDGWEMPTDGGEWEFQPLDNFGTPNAGCTYIQMQDETGTWQTI